MTKSKSNKETLYESLKRQILSMTLEPGASLDETTLSQSYALSRTPVRDVLRLLAGEGYVTIRENRGTFVSPMTHKTLRAFFQTAPPIYAAVAGLAVENHTPAQLADLKLVQQQFTRAVRARDAEQMAVHNNRFHLILGEMADNPYLHPSLQRLLIDPARIAQTFYRPRDKAMRDRMNASLAHHDRFIALIEERDADGARALAVEHWELSRHSLDMFVRPDTIELDMGGKASQ